MIYLNGEFVAPDQAKVSIFDRGYLFSDGVYEVVPIQGSKFFLFDEHIQRLNRSLQAIKMSEINFDFKEVAEKLKADQKINSGIVYIQVTRGVGAKRNHVWKDGELTPSLLMFCQEMTFDTEPKGLKTITVEDIRWGRCDIKSLSLLPNILSRREADDRGCDEAIQYRDNLVTEGTSTNVFIVKDGKVKTPKLKSNILSGVTRKYCLDVLEKSEFDCEEADIALGELEQADEIWLTSSTKDVLPVVVLNEKPVGDGQIGPCWRKFSELYGQEKQHHLS